MEPVNVHALDIGGEMAAAGLIAFGAAVCRSAAKTVKGAPNTTAGEENLLGIAVDDMIEKDEVGFYSLYDAVPIARIGAVRVWVTPDDDDASIVAGDYLTLKVLGGGSNTLPVGVFAEAGDGAGEVKTLNSSARALEDVTLTSAANYIVVAADLAVGGVTVTIADSSKFTVGDYIVLEDLDGNAMMNRVKAIPSSTTITLQIASTVALANATDYVHILAQCEVKLL
jgi:hypothetical protein